MGDRVEEVVVTGVKARMHHSSSYTKHSSTSVLKLDVELDELKGPVVISQAYHIRCPLVEHHIQV